MGRKPARKRRSRARRKLPPAKTPALRPQRREQPERAPGKRVRESQAEMVEVVLPNDANPLGNILGGRVMHLVDIAAAIAAHRHSNSYVVTASVDHVDFRTPIKVGELIVLQSSVNRVFRTSLEVGVKVFAENVLTGERKHTSSAYVTFVAIDEQGQPKPVPPVICETPNERRRFQQAGLRRQWRLAHRFKKISREEVNR
ncbi:MAG: acyl-CoA thioesterase [Terriglobia bacterium]